MLKPRGFGTMTALSPVRSPCRAESRRDGGSKPDRRLGYRRDGATGRNVFERHTAALFRARQVDHYRMPMSLDSPLNATAGAMNASGIDTSRLRYGDQSSGPWRAADPKSQPGRAFGALSTAALDGRLHMRQEYGGRHWRYLRSRIFHSRTKMVIWKIRWEVQMISFVA